MNKKNIIQYYKTVILITVLFIAPSILSAQFIDDFNSQSLTYDASGVNGWMFRTGDGKAEINFIQAGNVYASIGVDATKDKRGIWWAIIRRRVSKDMDLSLFNKPNYEFRIEARIKSHSAPRRVNLHLNTQRTTDFHSHLMEFDIPDTINWQTISMTTHNFDARPGDSVYGQMALMDWGVEEYQVDVDYFKVDIVNIDSTSPDKGTQVPYHPPVPSVSTFNYHLPVAQNAMLNIEYPDMNFKNWGIYDNNETIRLLTVNGTQFIILKWDLSQFAGKKIEGLSLLELTTYSLQRSKDFQKDFGMIRVSEIIGGETNWGENSITYSDFCKGQPISNVINSQMVIDVEVNEDNGGKNYITISNPVLQRMIDGKTFGLAVRPLGAVNASFYSNNNEDINCSAKLHFNIKKNENSSE